MKIKRFIAETSREALAEVKELFGSEAVILSNKKIGSDVEIIAAIDFDFSKDGYFSKEMHAEAKRTEEERNNKINTGSFQVLQQEIEALKLTLSNQDLSNKVYNHPMQTILADQLYDHGFCSLLVDELLSGDVTENHIDKLKINLYKRLKDHYVNIDDGVDFEQSSSIFVGLSGVGKSTALIKMASDIVKKNGPKGVVIYTTDDYKLSGYMQLKSYADILGISVHQIKKLREIDDVFNAKYNHILIDTDPMFLNDQENVGYLSTLKKIVNKNIKIYQVLSATTSIEVVANQVQELKDLKPSCIVTKFDEAQSKQVSKILSYLLYMKVAISYFDKKPLITERLTKACPTKVLHAVGADKLFIQENRFTELLQEKLNATT